MKDSIRLDKFIAASAPCSRKDAVRMLREGRVCVNTEVCKSGERKLLSDDSVTLDGRPLSYSKYVYYMMNKPKGVVSATEDKHDRTVIDLVPPALRRQGLFPAGRLDKDTTGLLILTDDGELAHRMLSPKKHVSKRYIAQVDRLPESGAEERFREGLTLHDGTRCLPAVLTRLDDRTVAVELCEGKFHQVKKMLHQVGSVVEELSRVQIGGLKLDENLAPGECRALSEEEINDLFK